MHGSWPFQYSYLAIRNDGRTRNSICRKHRNV